MQQTDDWQTTNILVLGTTYPSYSKKYKEVACTGGIDERSGRMVRLFPIPKRYLETEHQFKRFQWIQVAVRPNVHDGRPESISVNPKSIVPGKVLEPKDPERLKWVEKCPMTFRSVEALHDAWTIDRTSLGIVRPSVINGVRLRQRSPSERNEWAEREKEILSQRDFFEEVMPLDFPEYEFCVKFQCDDPRCTGHEMTLKDWGVHELARKLRRNRDQDWQKKVAKKITDDINLEKRDVFFFFGNLDSLRFEFALMGSFSVEKKKIAQLNLFGG